MPSKKSEQIKSFIAMDILEAAQKLRAQGRDVISFGLGEPDFQPPACVQEACIRAIRENKTKYTHSQGLYELREEICKSYQTKYGVSIDPDQVIVTPGTSPAFFLIFSTLLERHDEVILPNPHYPCDANFVEFFGGRVVELPISEQENYQWNLSEVKKRISSQTKALFVTSPSNPTGTVLSEDVLKGLALTGVPIVSDEIYHGLVYDGKEHSILEYTDNAFVVNGFSKSYAMTGYRLGYVIAPKNYVRFLQKIQQNFIISVSEFIQIAGLSALKDGEQDQIKMRGEFFNRREVMNAELKRIGFSLAYKPQGAFYFFVNAKHLSSDSYTLAFDILQKTAVTVTPGIDFGTQGEGHLRFSYATSIENIYQGMARLEEYFSEG